MQHFVNNKRQPSNKDKIEEKSGKEGPKQKKFPPCTHCKKTTSGKKLLVETKYIV